MINSGEITFLTGKLVVGTLIFFRILGMMSSAPFFRGEAINMQVRVLLALMMAFGLTETCWKEQPQIDLHLWNMVILVLKEFMVGLAIGFGSGIVFWAARMAGGLIDFDMGYNTSALFSSEELSPTLIGELKYMVVLMVFLLLNGHHYLIEAVYASVRVVPLTTFAMSESTIQVLIRMSTMVFIIAIKMAAPVLMALFLTNLALSLLARAAPQTNIFVLSFQVKVILGLLVMIASAPLVVMVAKASLHAMESESMKLILTLNPARV
jgi:flagellar biosynthetic protein FliR